MIRSLPLRFVLFLLIATLSCVLILLVAYPVGKASLERLKQQVERELAHRAFQMQDKLDRGLFERLREITNTARHFGHFDGASEIKRQHAWLDDLKAGYPDYSWIGLVNTKGRIVLGAGERLEGTDVSALTWFQTGLRGPFVGDVHAPSLLPDIASTNDSTLARIVDLAAPVINREGQTIGVIAALLNWGWAGEVEESIIGTPDVNDTSEIIVLNGAGDTLLGPVELLGKRLVLKGIERSHSGATSSFVEVWPDGKTYLTGISQSTGYRSFRGLGWITLARQRADVAYAAVTRQTHEIIFWALLATGTALLMAHVVSKRIAGPLIALAEAAEQTRRGDCQPLPLSSAYAEAATLSNSLRSLVEQLQSSQQNLRSINNSLDQTVRQRTSELEQRNLSLEAARDEAQRATSSKTRFLMTASHDLRQPLQAVTLLLRAAARRITQNEPKELISKAERGIQSLRTMFDTLLDISRYESGSVRPVPEIVSLVDLLDEMAPGFSAEAKQCGLKFRWRSLPVSVIADRSILQTIIRNLVANAIKFTRTGGVLLGVRRLGDGSVTIDVWRYGNRHCGNATRICFRAL